MKLFKLLFFGALLIACGTSRVYHNNISSYEENVTPVKNIFLIIHDGGAGKKSYQKLEEYLQNNLSRRGVAMHFFYPNPGDSLAEKKIKDSAIKYQFDFIIKQTGRSFLQGSTTITTQGSMYSGGVLPNYTILGPSTTEMGFMGYRKKEKYQLVWKCSCEGMRTRIFQTVPKAAGECLIKSLAEQKLIPSEDYKR
jgi:hypothetical protein